MKVLAGVGWPLVAIGLWIEVYALVIQVVTDGCSFGYCPVGHGTSAAAPHGAAALMGTLAVVVLAGMLLIDRRLSRVSDNAVATAVGKRAPVTTALIVVFGIVVGFAALTWLTWGQPFGWIAVPPPCVPPEPEMNLFCDTETSAEAFHAYGPSAFLIATGAGSLVVAGLLAVRRIVGRMSGWVP